MKKSILVLVLVVIAGGAVCAMDFGKINSTLGPGSFTVSPYVSFLPSVGANMDWAIKSLPLTIGLGASFGIPLGDLSARLGYHPDFGVKGLDVYAVLSAGLMTLGIFPLPFNVGMHLGARYFFTPAFGAFLEGGWAMNLNYARAGVSIKIGGKSGQ